MKAAMDRSGRVVIPSRARTQLALRPGQEFDIRVVEGGRLELEPIGVPVRLVNEEGLLILDAEDAVEPVTDADVREAVERHRVEHEQRWP
ncbi:MAG: AbrB/MazE/SpoVT family DNA-binding domain-containing protein [Candidatus Dormibacteria bacterium]